MTKDDILHCTRPEDLFPFDEAEAKQLYRRFAHQWHPDRSHEGEIFSHITALWNERTKKIANGLWEGPSQLKFETDDGYFLRFESRKMVPFTLGLTYICADRIVYVVEALHGKLFKNFQHDFIYASAKMKEEFQRYLPNIISMHRLADTRLLLQVAKASNLIRLADLPDLDVRHCAWIISRLLNQVCYHDYTRLVHHDLSLDTYYIDPAAHTGHLLGGWWYATTTGDPITTVPKRTFEVMPYSAKAHKMALPSTDCELVRLTGRELIRRSTDIPAPMRAFLGNVGSGSPRQQFAEWSNVLERSFGPRRFIHLPLTAEDVYGKALKVGV